MPSDLIAAARVAASQAPNVLPCAELQEILLPAYSPCPNLTGPCASVARWNPHAGHVPRGFIGATGSPDEVEVVLITAEPGDPLSDEMYDDQTPLAMLARTCSHYYGILALAPTWRDRNLIFHRNLRRVLDLCWPDMTLDQQLRRAWIVDSYLCSAPVESGPVLRSSWAACAQDYLQPQLELFSDSTVVALGGKARQRIRRYVPNLVTAYSVAPPGAHRHEALATWEAAAAQVRRARSV